MRVPEISFYIDLGLWYLKLLLALSFPAIVYVIRMKWELAVAKEVEIRRLMALAAAETARAEEEAAEVGYYADGSLDRAAFGCGVKTGVEQDLIGCCPEVTVHSEAVLSNVEAQKCAVCSIPTMARCSQCKSVWYCSTICQIFDWREGHKDKCYPPCIPTQTSNEKICHQEKKVNFTYSAGTLGSQLNASSTHLEENVFCSIGSGTTKQLNGSNDGIKDKTFEQLKLSISNESFSTTFSSKSSLSRTISYSSDDTSSVESSDSSDLGKCNGCQHDDTSSQAKSATQLANKIKQCDPNGSNAPPSKLKTGLCAQHENQKTSTSSRSSSVESCDHSVAKPGPSDFLEGALNCGCLKYIKTKPQARNDCLSNIGSSLCSTSGLDGKIDKRCHVRGKLHGSHSVSNEPSSENASSKKNDLSSYEVGISVLSSPNIPKQVIDVDSSVLKYSGDYNSSLATVLSSPDGKNQGDAQKVSISPLSINKKGSYTNSGTNHISKQRLSSASTDEIIHSVKRDNSCQANDVSQFRNAKDSSLFAKQLGHALDSSESTEQLLKPKVVRSLHSTSHVTHTCKDASPVSNVDVEKSNVNVATCDKSYSSIIANDMKMPTQRNEGHFQVSKPSIHRGAYNTDVNTGGFSYELFKSLYRWNKIELQPCGLVNCGNSCYANAVLQCLMFTPPLTVYLLERLHSRSCTKRDWCFTCEFEKLILKAKGGKSPISPIGIMSQIQNIGSHLSSGSQEDAHEFLRYVVDAMQSICLEEAISKISGNMEEKVTLLSLTFGGYLQSKIRCLKCGNKSARSEKIMDLSVEIEGSIQSLEDALKRFTSSEMLDGENKYNCGRCKSYQKAKKKLTISEAPNVLTIALKRFQAGDFGKLSKWIDFPQILNLAPYMSGTSDDNAPVYDLYGVIVHLDTMNAAFSGHYVCYVKNIQKKWFKIDDSVVKDVDIGEVKKQSAYMLLYARCVPRAPRHLRDKLISDSKPKAAPSLARYSPDFNNLTSSKAYSNMRSEEFEADLYRDNNSLSSSCSDKKSCSTDNSIRQSNISDNLSDLISGDSGRGLRYHWNSSSNLDSNSPSISP